MNWWLVIRNALKETVVVLIMVGLALVWSSKVAGLPALDVCMPPVLLLLMMMAHHICAAWAEERLHMICPLDAALLAGRSNSKRGFWKPTTGALSDTALAPVPVAGDKAPSGWLNGILSDEGLQDLERREKEVWQVMQRVHATKWMVNGMFLYFAVLLVCTTVLDIWM